MGNWALYKDGDDTAITISRTHFKYVSIIGKGGFGKVWKVLHKSTKRVFAMKVMSKARILAKKSVNSVMNELELLSLIRHPMIVNIQYAF